MWVWSLMQRKAWLCQVWIWLDLFRHYTHHHGTWVDTLPSNTCILGYSKKCPYVADCLYVGSVVDSGPWWVLAHRDQCGLGLNPMRVQPPADSRSVIMTNCFLSCGSSWGCTMLKHSRRTDIYNLSSCRKKTASVHWENQWDTKITLMKMMEEEEA